jgi:hypothetical protein
LDAAIKEISNYDIREDEALRWLNTWLENVSQERMRRSQTQDEKVVANALARAECRFHAGDIVGASKVLIEVTRALAKQQQKHLSVLIEAAITL